MNKEAPLLKLPGITLVALMVLACSPKNPSEPAHAEAHAVTKATARVAGLQAENVGQLAQAEPQSAESHSADPLSSDPRSVDYFKYLDFERRTYSDIRIWGWSRDGKVAYSDFLSHEGDRFTVFIFDMINDKTVWQKTFDLLAYYFSDDHDENFDIYNSDFTVDFKKVCVQNGIEFIQTEFAELPVRHNNQTVNIILEKNETSLSHNELEDLGQYGGRIDSYRIIAENGGRRKTVCEKDFLIYANDVFVCGYFLSPFEDRALIVIGEFAHGWEESVVTYSLIGCHLSIGFG